VKKPRNKVQTGGNRRQELLGVCARLFREKGFDGATIRDISAAAGMHSGSPFYHFPNKQEMLLAVMEEGLAQGLRRSEAVLAERLPPERVVGVLDEVFSAFDELAQRHGVEKIKTIGDAYMAVAGAPVARPDHVRAAADMALAMLDPMEMVVCREFKGGSAAKV